MEILFFILFNLQFKQIITLTINQIQCFIRHKLILLIQNFNETFRGVYVK